MKIQIAVACNMKATAGVTREKLDSMKPRERAAYLKKYPNSKYSKELGSQLKSSAKKKPAVTKKASA